MILIPIAIWLGLLWALVKFGVLKRWYLWMKISPLVIWVTALLVIFIPLNWTNPKGGALITVGSISVKPAVEGNVVEVPVNSWTPISQGDVLFQIDKTRYEAALDQAEAQLILAKLQLTRNEELLSRDAIAEAEVEALRTQVSVAEASVKSATFDLENTTVRAPFDGIVPAVTLLPGNWVNKGSPVMAFLDTGNPIVNIILKQNQLRNVKVGQPAEATFKALPGRTFGGTVVGIYPSSPDAEYQIDGATPEVPEVLDTTYVVTLNLEFEGVDLPAGSSGQAAIYTDRGQDFSVIQKITLRMTAWMNYF